MNKPNITGKTLVVLPYLASQAQGHELEFAIAGWRKHCQFKYIIALVGDYHPIVENASDIFFIECPRTLNEEPNLCVKNMDIANKIRCVRETFPNRKTFVLTADDKYAVGDFTLEDIKTLKVNDKDLLHGFNPFNKWRRDKLKTQWILNGDGLQSRNFTTHLPYWYDFDKLLSIFDKYDLAHESYVIEDLYYNNFFAESEVVTLSPDDNIRLALDTPDYEWDKLKDRIVNKKWIFNTNSAYTPELESFLTKYYDE